MVTNGIPALAQIEIEAQRIVHNDAKKKDCKTMFCIQSVVDAVNFDLTSYAEIREGDVRYSFQVLQKR